VEVASRGALNAVRYFCCDRKRDNTVIEGSLDIYWENKDDVAATARYRLRFLPLRTVEMTLGPKLLVGKEALLDYLTTMQDWMT